MLVDGAFVSQWRFGGVPVVRKIRQSVEPRPLLPEISPARLVRWHLREAQACRTANCLAASRFHVDQALQLDPQCQAALRFQAELAEMLEQAELPP